MPFRVEPGYADCPGAISMVTAPPEASVMRPACTAAVQMEESCV